MDAAVLRSLKQKDMTKRIQSLLGIISGVMADGVLNDSEIHFLQTWLTQNSDLRGLWPASVIGRKIDEVLDDGRIDETERGHLASILTGAAGSFFTDTGAAQPEPTNLPVNDCVTITMVNSSVCHTGEFLYGTRAACERLTLKAGGMPADSVTRRLDILVIGTISAPTWAHGSYGRKIESAVKLQDAGHAVEIITEKRWLEAIEAAAAG
jgi:NAD-dependent DNA ligase